VPGASALNRLTPDLHEASARTALQALPGGCTMFDRGHAPGWARCTGQAANGGATGPNAVQPCQRAARPTR